MITSILFSLTLNLYTACSTVQPLPSVEYTKDERCWISGTSVRMRSRPSRNGDILAVFNNGENVKIIRSHDVKDDWGNTVEFWYLVRRRNGTEGWVHGDYVDCNGC